MKNVAIIYRFLPQYRVEFYEQLRAILASNEIGLRLLYGEGDEEHRKKGDLVDLPWGIQVPNKIIKLGSQKVYWQPALKHLKNIDLIIVEQASRLLINYLLLARQKVGGTNVAFWGHGKNFQATEKNGLAEWLKQRYSKFPHWWFAYNDLSAKVLGDLGYPSERVTVVENAIDTSRLREWLNEISDEEKGDARLQIGIRGSNVGIFIGALYPEKRLSFLISAAVRVRESIKDFELVIAGDGVDRELVEAAASRYPWILYCGPRFGREKAVILSLGQLLLMPGAVGLVVLDGFAAGLPTVTTDINFHGPEIDYLKHNENGFVCSNDIGSYSDTVIAALRNKEELEKVRIGALASSQRYTVENMVERFAQGIRLAMGAESASGRRSAQKGN